MKNSLFGTIFIFIMSVLLTQSGWASNGVPALLPFQGRATDTSGNPINYPVQIKFRIYPPAGACYLYEEIQNVTPNSYGIFSVMLGTGTVQAPGNALAQVFNNDAIVALTDSCSQPYVSAANDWRRLELIVDGTSLGMQTIGSSAFALNAQLLQGKSSSDFILKSVNVTQANIENLVGGSDASSLHNHDSIYARRDGSNNFSGNVSTTGNILASSATGSIGVGTAAPTADIDIKKDNPTIKLQSNSGSGGIPGLDFYGGTNLRGKIEASESTNGIKFYSGSSQAMQIDAFGNLLLNGSLKVAGTTGLGQYTDAQEAGLITSLTALGSAAKGTLWINTTSNTVKFWDGTQAVTVLGGSSAVASVTAGSGVSVTGTATNPIVGLATSGVTGASYGSASSVATFTVDSYGRLTTAGTSPIAITADQVINAAGKYFSYKPNNVACSDQQILKWDNAGSRWVCAAVAAGDVTAGLGYTPVNKAGDTMTGLLVLSADPAANLGAATKQYVDSAISSAGGNYIKKDGTVAFIGDQSMGSHKLTNVTDPTAAQDAATKNYVDTKFISKALPAAPAAGQDGQAIRWNNGTSAWEYFTPNSGAVTSVTGTAPVSISGTASAPVVAISQANTTTDGYLSSTDWNAFNTKLGTATSFTGDVSGNYNTTSVDKIKGKSVVPVAYAAGQTLRYDGTNWVNAVLGFADIGGKPTTLAGYGITDATSSTLASGKILVGNGSNVATAVSMSGDAAIDNAGAIALASSGVTAGTYSKVTVDAKGRVTVGANIASGDVTAALGYTPLNKAGDVMSGTLGLQQVASDPSTAGWNGTQKGYTWFNTTSNQVKYWDGSAIQALGVSGAGLTSLNGQTGSTQTFATPGTSGTAPAWSSAGNAHTLNIPLASTAAVTAGLISKTDYDTFNTKLGTATAFSGDVSGNYNTTSVDKIKGKAVVPVAYAAGQTLRYDGTNWVNAVLGFADLGGKPTTLAGYGITDATSSTLANGKILVGNGSNIATAVTMSGDTTIDNAGAVTLASSGVTAGTYSKVTVDLKGRVTVGASISASDVTTALTYTPLNKAGDVMTGSLGLNAVASDPAGLVAGDKGKVWYNTTSSQVKYWDGAAAQALGVSGAGLTSLNGQVGSTQTFATPGTSGTAPAWSSATNAHTLNIPMASTAAVTAGLISKTDYDAFNTKLGTATSFSGDVSGNYNSTSVDKIKGKAVVPVAYAAGQTLRYDGTNWVNAVLGFADLGGKPTTIAGYGITDAVNKTGDTMTGLLVLSADPAANLGAATKQYVDTKFISKTLPAVPGAGQNGQAIRWNNGTTAWEYFTPSTGTVTSVTASAPLASSGGATPNITVTQSNTSTDGYLSSTDWNTFNNKLGTATSFSGDVSGNYNSTSVDKIKGKAVVPVAYAAGQTLRYDGTNWVNAVLGFADLSGKPTTIAGYGITDAVNKTGDTMTGLLVLSADPAANLGASTKQYVDSAITSAGGNYIKKDGTVAFIGDQSMGSHKLTNLATPTVSTDGATKGYVDSVAGVASFNGRVGAVSPAANDYTWAQVNKTTSSLADLTTRSATDLSSGTLSDALLSTNVVMKNAGNTWSTGAQDFSAATSLRVPAAAGAAPTTSGFVAYDTTANQWVAGVNGVKNYIAQAAAALTSGQFVQGGGNGAVSASGYSPSTAGSAGIAPFNAGSSTNLARNDHTHKVFYTMQWFFPGIVSSGVQTVRAQVPRGVTNCIIADSQITVDTTASGASTYNIQRCTAAGPACTSIANIYSSAVSLGATTESVAGGAPNTTTINAGDVFRVNLVSVGSGLANVSVAMTYKCENTN